MNKKLLLAVLAVIAMSQAAFAAPGSLYFSAGDSTQGQSLPANATLTANVTGVAGKQAVVNSIFYSSDSTTVTLDIQTAASGGSFSSRQTIFATVTAGALNQLLGQGSPLYVAPAGHSLRVLINGVTQAAINVAGEYL